MIYAVGDIHGQHTMLLALLDKLVGLPLKEEDTLIFPGDYVDRGEDSHGVVETLLNLKKRLPRTIFLRGNHEQIMLDVYDSPDLAAREARMLTWLHNGGVETLLSYHAPGFRDWQETILDIQRYMPPAPLSEFKANCARWLEAVPQSHVTFLRTTEMECVTDCYHFVHAGLLEPGQTSQSEGWEMDPRLWIRQPFLSSRADFGGRVVVFGHTPQRGGRPLVRSNKIGLDTGAAFGGPLMAGIFDTEGGCKGKAPHFLQAPYAHSASSQRERANPRASSARSRRK